MTVNSKYNHMMNINDISSLSLPKEPLTLDSMTTTEFDSIMETGLSQAKSDQSRPVSEVFAKLREQTV